MMHIYSVYIDIASCYSFKRARLLTIDASVITWTVRANPLIRQRISARIHDALIVAVNAGDERRCEINDGCRLFVLGKNVL